METLGAFIASIVSGLIANYISSKLENKNNFNIKPKPLKVKVDENTEYDETDMEAIRQYNRANLKNKFDNFIFFVLSYIAIGASLFYPLFLYAGIGKNEIDFNKTRLMYDFILNKNDFILASAIFAFILYLPVLFISNKVAKVISTKLTNYTKITTTKLVGLRILVILFLVVFIVANVYYILNPIISWWDAIKFTFIIVFFFLAMGANSQ